MRGVGIVTGPGCVREGMIVLGIVTGLFYRRVRMSYKAGLGCVRGVESEFNTWQVCIRAGGSQLQERAVRGSRK